LVCVSSRSDSIGTGGSKASAGVWSQSLSFGCVDSPAGGPTANQVGLRLPPRVHECPLRGVDPLRFLVAVGDLDGDADRSVVELHLGHLRRVAADIATFLIVGRSNAITFHGQLRQNALWTCQSCRTKPLAQSRDALAVVGAAKNCVRFCALAMNIEQQPVPHLCRTRTEASWSAR